MTTRTTTKAEREAWMQKIDKEGIALSAAYRSAVPALCEHVERLEGLLREASGAVHHRHEWDGSCLKTCLRCRIEQELLP